MSEVTEQQAQAFVEKWCEERRRGRSSTYAQMILAALRHFTPERVEMEISGMTPQQIREAFLYKVFTPIDPKRDRMDETIRLADVFAAVAHRLATTPKQPKVDPDPDAGAKAAAWTWITMIEPTATMTYRDADDYWSCINDVSHNGWRAVAAGRERGELPAGDNSGG